MTGLILCHFMNGIMDSVETCSLSVLSNAELIFASTSLSSSTLLQIGLSIPNALAQQFCETRSMVSLLKSITLESLGNLRIALAIGLTSHCEVHTDFATLAIEVVAQVLNHLFADTLGLTITNLMNGGVGHISIFLQFRELRGRSLTDGALLGSRIAFVNITTNGADKLFLHNNKVFV